MRPMLFCVDGDLAGTTFKPTSEDVVVGAAPDCDVPLGGNSNANVAPRHARIHRLGESFSVMPLDGDVRVNDEPVTSERRLVEGDSLKLGDLGPSFRFRIGPDPRRTTKSLKQMVGDSAAYSRAPGRTTQIRSFAHQFVKEAVANSTRPFKIAVLVLGVAVAFLLGLLIWNVVDGHRTQAALETRLREQLDRENASLRTSLEEEKAARRTMSETLAALGSHAEESDASLAMLLARTPELERVTANLMKSQAAAREIHSRYNRSVSFILVGCYLYNPDRDLFVRFANNPDGTRLLRNGSPVVRIGGDGPKYVEWTTGSGFVVSKEGHIVTNRHVLDPWWQNEERYGEGIMAMGFRPVRHILAAAFPDREGIFPLTRCGVSEAADVSLCRLKDGLPEGLAIVPMAPRERIAETGQKSILLGYPLGYEGLLVKLEKKTAAELGMSHLEEIDQAVDLISRRQGIKVTMTEGIIGSVTPEQLVYDAVTTFGGSGGPLFNADGQVIAVNAAISRFAGANLGVPILFAQDLFDDGTSKKQDTVEAPELAASAVK